MNIIITEFCGLGNSVLLSSALKQLKKSQKVYLSYIGNNKFSGLTIHKFNNCIDEIIDISNFNIKIFTKFFKKIKESDAIIIPEHSNPNLLFLIASTIYSKKKIIVSENFQNRQNILKKIIFKFLVKFNKINLIKISFSENFHEIQINKKFIDSVVNIDHYEEKDIFYNYFDHPEDPECLKKFNLNNVKYIVIQMFSANGLITSKNWPTENFKKLIYSLLEFYDDYEIVLIGDSGDKKHLSNFIQDKKIKNLISKTNLIELITILKNSSFVICHDSSILHLSDSMGIKNLSLFGGASKLLKNKPNNHNSFLIHKNRISEINFIEVLDKIKKNI